MRAPAAAFENAPAPRRNWRGQAWHIPKGDPCTFKRADGRPCGLPPSSHRVDHYPQGDPCKRCGLGPGPHRTKRHKLNSERHFYVGIDGEGQGDRTLGRDSDHRYCLLAWSDEAGKRKDFIEAPPGGALSSEQCLDFILRLPLQARAFAFAFNYDLTKILQDVDNEALWLLFRAERRKRRKGFEKHGPKPVHWRHYKLNIQGSKFTVVDTRDKTAGKRGRRRVVWDTFKFYQAKFTSALEDWYKCSKHEKLDIPPSDCPVCGIWVQVKPAIEQMKLMKAERHRFDQISRPQVREYCFSECGFMAGLTRKLVEAHAKAQLDLRSFHGAGSTAGAVLKTFQIDKTSKGRGYQGPFLDPDEWKARRNGPKAMWEAIAMAFFGGRFEHSVIGGIPGPIFGKDISSAYPYQLYWLPCLECGTWELTKDRDEINNTRAALVQYGLDASTAPPWTWGPFPFRDKKGSIAFPLVSGGGWVWRDEYLQGERMFPHVRFKQAWVYRCNCNHHPFREIPMLYVERLRIGKEGPGIVIKLGCNACYGKLAQSLGDNPPFQSWIWAGMITSGTRAQLLEVTSLHTDWATTYNVLAKATDGIYSRENVKAPAPRETMTPDLWLEYRARLVSELGPGLAMVEFDRARKLFEEKPLGGWETKVVKQGMFFARPGIYWPLNATEKEINAVRARGVGRAALYANWKRAIRAFENGNRLHRPGCEGLTCHCPREETIHAIGCKGVNEAGDLTLPELCQCPLGDKMHSDTCGGSYCDCDPGASISGVERFHGAKSSISRRAMTPKEIEEATAKGDWGINPLTGKPRKKLHPFVYERGPMLDEHGSEPKPETLTRKQSRSRYGQWSRRGIDMSFNPMPKRAGINEGGTLSMRNFPPDLMSEPYDKTTWSEDRARLVAAMEELNEQPDGGDYSTYERGLES